MEYELGDLKYKTREVIPLKILRLLGLFAMLGLILFLPYNSPAQSFDYKALKTIETHRSSGFTSWNKAISASEPYISVGFPIALYGIGLLKKDKQLQQNGIGMGISLVITAGATQGLKRLIQRKRPYNAHPDLHPLSSESSFSMPSGHTSLAFHTATFLTLTYPKWYVAVPAYTWAGATGYSRMYLGVHYPSDIAFGAALGAGSAWASWYLQRRLFR